MKRMFVGNLAPETTENELTAVFNEFGKVRFCDIDNYPEMRMVGDPK